MNQQKPSNHFRLRNTLNLIFILAVLVLIRLYYTLPHFDTTSPWFIGLGLFAVVIKFTEMAIRYLPNKKEL